MRAALVEWDTRWEDAGANRAGLDAALGALDADAAVLPELAFSGFTMTPPPDPGAEEWLRAAARAHDIGLVAGHAAPGPRNRVTVVARDGETVARYDKLHPFRYAGEHEHYAPGDDLPVFPFGGFSCAALICYDLRFPEAFRDAALRGAELFFVPANWPARRVGHWHALLRARAIENLAYVVGVNRAGRDPNEEYVSSSAVVDPTGAIVHEGPGVVTLDRETVRRARADFPALDDIRYRFER